MWEKSAASAGSPCIAIAWVSAAEANVRVAGHTIDNNEQHANAVTCISRRINIGTQAFDSEHLTRSF
jgi:hypothetical protein